MADPELGRGQLEVNKEGLPLATLFWPGLILLLPCLCLLLAHVPITASSLYQVRQPL